MRTAITLFALLLMSISMEASPIILKGSLSPSKKFSLAVLVDKPGDEVEQKEGIVCLMDARAHKKIGPLEEVDSSGGSWGRTTSNVNANWSPDSRWLAVTFRTGRLMHDYVIYEIAGRRAIPVALPSETTHPKGKIYDFLIASANPGSSFSAWLSPKSFVVVDYGMRPKDPDHEQVISKFGLEDFDGALEKVYELGKNGGWILKDIRVPKDRQ